MSKQVNSLSSFCFKDYDYTHGDTGSVGEPSVAQSHNMALFTGNWYAVRNYRGQGWEYISPYDYFPEAQGPFCCDQTAICDRSGQYIFWLLQYSYGTHPSSGYKSNTLRVAVNDGTSSEFPLYYDFVPEEINPDWVNQWFDYNHAVVTDNYLYVGTNMFTSPMFDGDDKTYIRSVVFRIPIADLVSGQLTTPPYLESNEGTVRCVEGATDTMYFASSSHYQLTIHKWEESSLSGYKYQVAVSQTESNPSSILPDGTDWLARCGKRMMAGYLLNGVLGFMWTSAAFGTRPNPFVRVARIAEGSMKLIDEPDIYSTMTAFAYPSATVNSDGDIGISLFAGGVYWYPAVYAGCYQEEWNSWSMIGLVTGTNGPADDKWGDYLTCRLAPNGQDFLAAGFVLRGGQSRHDLEPWLFNFSITETT